MNAVEKFDAAVVWLEALKVSSTQKWARDHASADAIAVEREVVLCLDDLRDADAELMLTLHRSIDAQLKFLRDALTAALADERYFSYDYAVALADAILDGDS